MDNYTKLAKEIRKRDNKKVIGICVGEVTSLTPVNIRIYYNGEPINKTEFFDVKGLMNGGSNITKGDLYVEEYPVEIGDRFLCIAANDNQSIYVIGKFESIEDLSIYLLEEG